MNDMLKDELCHKWNTAKKADYNHDYYRKHKEWWRTKYASLGDSESRIREAQNKLTDAKRRMARAEDLRREKYAKAAKNVQLSNEAALTGLPAAAKALREKAGYQRLDGAEYAHQRDDIKNKHVNMLEGDVARLKAERDLHKSGKVKQAPSARVDKTVSDHDRGDYKYVDNKFDKAVSKAEDLKRKLDLKAAPAKNKAKRKAKEFVSNWKSGAQGIKSAAKSASSKAGKRFLDTKIATRVTNFKSPSGTTTTKSPITIGDVLKGSKKPKRTLSGQPNGFVENWKQGAGDIKNAITKKKRKK